MNDEHYNEQDAHTQRLLNSICEGVELPTQEDEAETLDLQHG